MTFETDIHGIEVTVEYTYHPFIRGARDSFNGRSGQGIQLEPDEPAYVEIDSVVTKLGEDLTGMLAPRIMHQLELEAEEDYQSE